MSVPLSQFQSTITEHASMHPSAQGVQKGAGTGLVVSSKLLHQVSFRAGQKPSFPGFL